MLRKAFLRYLFLCTLCKLLKARSIKDSVIRRIFFVLLFPLFQTVHSILLLPLVLPTNFVNNVPQTNPLILESKYKVQVVKTTF